MSASDDGATTGSEGILRAFSIARSVGGGLNLAETFVALFLIPIAAFFVGLGDVITATINTLVIPLSAFATGVGNLVTAIFAGLAFVIGEAAGAQGESFRQGVLSLFSPFALPFGTLVILASLFLIAQYLELESTSDLIPGAVTDFFGVGADEEA